MLHSTLPCYFPGVSDLYSKLQILSHVLDFPFLLGDTARFGDRVSNPLVLEGERFRTLSLGSSLSYPFVSRVGFQGPNNRSLRTCSKSASSSLAEGVA